MALETASLRRNLSRLEVAVVIVIIAVLFAMFMARMGAVEGAAERSILQARYQDMQARLLTLKVSLLSQGGTRRVLTVEDIVRHIGRGDVQMLRSRGDPAWQRVQPGTWAWVKDRDILLYRVINEDFFELGSEWPHAVRFKLEPRYVDINRNGRYDEPGDRLTGAALMVLDRAAFGTTGAAGPRGNGT